MRHSSTAWPSSADRSDLAAARAASWEFGPTLANHLPMALIALARLGATPGRLAEFAETYRANNGLVPPPPPVARIGWENWTQALGERARETDFRVFFALEHARLGAAGLQRRALPVLLPGIAASALHALMRLAYAHLDGAEDEIATALAYWATTYLTLPAGNGVPDTLNPSMILQHLRDRPELCAIEPPTDLLWHAMRAVGGDPRFVAVLDRFATDGESLARLNLAARALFAAAPDFCSLHALTAVHWLRLLPADVVNRSLACRYLWRALAAVYPKMGMPRLPTAESLDELRHRPCAEWPEIAAAAVASNDEHDHSMVFSAREEERLSGDPLYRRLAARRVGLM